MRKISFLVITICLELAGIHTAFAQTNVSNYKIIYHLAFQQDTNVHELWNASTQLLIDGERSLFQFTVHAISDSIKYHGMDPSRRIIRSGIGHNRYTVLKDFAKGRIEYYETFLTGHQLFYHEEPLLSPDDWNISPDTMTIDNRLCQKAEVEFGNRKWIAWFDPEIAITDGPYKFSGLPGLIVHMYDAQESWIFKLTSIEQINPMTIDMGYLPPTNKIDNKLDFFSKKKEILDNSIQIMRTTPGMPQIRAQNDPNDFELNRTHKESRKKDNNWIEQIP